MFDYSWICSDPSPSAVSEKSLAFALMQPPLAGELAPESNFMAYT